MVGPPPKDCDLIPKLDVMKTKNHSAFTIHHWALPTFVTALLTALALITTPPRAPAQSVWGAARSGGVVEVPHTAALNAFPLTVSAWINTTNRDAGRDGGVVHKYRSASTNGFNLYLREGRIRAWYFKDSENYVWDGGQGLDGGDVADGIWHHVAFTVGANGGKLYVDGALRALTNWTGIPGPPTTQEPIWLGFYPPTDGLIGLMDDARIWNAERSAEEIREHLGRPLSGTESNLVAYWKFDECGGTAVHDSTSNIYDGLASSPFTRTPSTIPTWGTALSFDGVDDYVEVPHTAALNAFPLTVSAWINTTDRSLGREAGVVNKYLSASANGFNLFLREGRIRAWYFKDSENYVWDGGHGLDGGDVADGIWHHVAFTVGTNGGNLYVDGALRASTNWTGIPGPPTTQEPICLGYYPGPGELERYFQGLMDEVRIWNAERSPKEIKEHLDRPLSGTEANLVACWNFNERAGTNAFDGTTNEHIGTLENGPAWTNSMRHPVLTIYFCGTGITKDWWVGANAHVLLLGFWTPELVSTLHHEQIATDPLHYKKIVDGIGTGEGYFLDWLNQALLRYIEDTLGGRGWDTCKNEGIGYLNEVLSDHPHDQVILNLVGFSRGAVSTMMMANAVKDYPQVKRINIIAFDPVPGDTTIPYGIFCLPEKVKHYVGFYALDERTDQFEPVVPTAASPADTEMWKFTVPGSHETMVGNLQVDGHSTTQYDDNIVSTLIYPSWITKVIAVELLGSSDWGHVRFNWDWYKGEVNEQVLSSKFIEMLDQMWSLGYNNIHKVPFNPLGLCSYRYSWVFDRTDCWIILAFEIGFGAEDYPRCAFSYDCVTKRTFGLTSAIVPAVDESVWARLREFGSLDFDGDGIDFADDNCPEIFNPDQRDVNGNGIGDVGELAIKGLGDGDSSISWDHEVGAVLQMATQVQGPWTNVANQANPYITTPNLPAAFFRLEIQ